MGVRRNTLTPVTISRSPGTISRTSTFTRAVSNHLGAVGEVLAQGLDRARCLTLLHERERCVDDHDRGDRRREHRRAGDPREAARHPQEERKGMHDLPSELTRPSRAAAPSQLVCSVLAEEVGRLCRGEAGLADRSARAARKPPLASAGLERRG